MLWEKVTQDEALGLITDTEVVTSTVTVQEAKAFMEGKDFTPTASAPTSATAPGLFGHSKVHGSCCEALKRLGIDANLTERLKDA